MKRMALIIMAGVLMIAALCGCGVKAFTCDYCMEEKTENPHEMTLLGQECEICDSCYEVLK